MAVFRILVLCIAVSCNGMRIRSRSSLARTQLGGTPINTSTNTTRTGSILHWTYNGTCFWTSSYTEYDVTVSCAWYEKVACGDTNIETGPCPQSSSLPSHQITLGNSSFYSPYRMDSCAHYFSGPVFNASEWFEDMLSTVNEPCKSKCPNKDDLIDSRPLSGRKVIASAQLGQDMMCYELESLFAWIREVPQNPLNLKCDGDSRYTLRMLKDDMEDGPSFSRRSPFPCVAL